MHTQVVITAIEEEGQGMQIRVQGPKNLIDLQQGRG